MKRNRTRSSESIDFARDQRSMANEFAQAAWQWLRNRRCCGQKFRREFPIPPYTVDFCCLELKLVIEIDGSDHLTEEGIIHDRNRDAFLKNQGYKILRIPGFQIIRNGAKVVEQLNEFVSARIKELENACPSPPAPLPCKARGEGS